MPHTSTYALTNVTLSYALELADKGMTVALRENPALQRGLNTMNGEVVHPGVAAAFDLPRADPIAELSAKAE